jgi:hypothetical protein
MRKPLVWLGGVLGLAALVRALRNRKPAAGAPSSAPNPADELRAVIADAGVDEPAGDAPTEPPSTLHERRQRVHERAQEAIDAMREPPPGA